MSRRALSIRALRSFSVIGIILFVLGRSLLIGSGLSDFLVEHEETTIVAPVALADSLRKSLLFKLIKTSLSAEKKLLWSKNNIIENLLAIQQQIKV